MRSPILSGPDVDWQMTCAVRLSENVEANARFEVTWYTDDGATPVGKNILGPVSLQAMTNFFDFPSNAKRVRLHVLLCSSEDSRHFPAPSSKFCQNLEEEKKKKKEK